MILECDAYEPLSAETPHPPNKERRFQHLRYPFWGNGLFWSNGLVDDSQDRACRRPLLCVRRIYPCRRMFSDFFLLLCLAKTENRKQKTDLTLREIVWFFVQTGIPKQDSRFRCVVVLVPENAE